MPISKRQYACIAALTIAATGVAATAEQPSAATVLRWDFDRAGLERDATGRHHLALHGKADAIQDGSSGALRFDGATTWAQGPDVASLGVGQDAAGNQLLDGQAGETASAVTMGVRIQARIRPAALDGEQVIVESYQSQGDQRSFRLALHGNRAVFTFSTDGTWRGSLDGGLWSDLRLKPGAWNDVVLTFDGRFIRFTINGEEDAARAYCPGLFAAPRPIQVGRRYDGKTADGYFRGDVDFIEISRLPLETPAESAVEAPAAPTPDGTRNNLVRDLLTLNESASGDAHEFVMPTAGWVCFMLEGPPAGDAAVTIQLRGTAAPLTLSAATDWLAMKRLDAGSHHFTVSGLSDGAASLVVRKVPEMMFVRFGYGAYDWAELSRSVLRYANVCVSARPTIRVTAGSTRWYVPESRAQFMGQRIDDTNAIIDAWTASGREWIVEMHSGYWNGEDAWRDAFAHWRDGFEGKLGGALVDEFGYYYDTKAYDHWARHVANLHASYPDKRFYAYSFGVERFPSNHVFFDEVLKRDGRIVWERYIREAPDEQKAHQALHDKLVEPMRIASQLRPGFAEQVVLCPSLWTGIGAFTDDFHGDVNQKVFIDMQFQLFATHPAYRGLAGIGPWSSGYASLEMVRWLGALYRHYGVEGNTGLLSSRYGYTYKLPHLDGPGFENADSLALSPATGDSLALQRVADLPVPITAPGKSYTQPLGETCLVFAYSDAAPNRVRQKIANLKPGELYAVQFFLADLDQPLERPQQPIPFRLELAGATLQPELEEQVVIASTRPNKQAVFLTRYQYVFRAQGAEAELTLSDWAGDSMDAARVGRRVICDNLAVEPYFSQELFDR